MLVGLVYIEVESKQLHEVIMMNLILSQKQDGRRRRELNGNSKVCVILQLSQLTNKQKKSGKRTKDPLYEGTD